MAEIISLELVELKSYFTSFGLYVKDNKNNIEIENFTHRIGYLGRF